MLGLTDVSVRSTEGDADGRWGDGIVMVDGAVVRGERLRVEDSRRFGVLVANGSDFDGTALTVRRTQPEACRPDRCPTESGYGVGLGTSNGGRARVSRFLVEASTLCGLLVEDGTELDVTDGEVRTAEIGACVQATGYDIARLSTRVAYHDVGRTLDATTLPVPSLPDPLGGL